MKMKKLLLALPILVLTGCSSVGRYQTVVNNDIAVMTDTATGQAWSTPVQGGHLVDKAFKNLKSD